MKYKWLQVSDLHSISTGIRTKIMREALLKEIKLINEEEKFSFILITGDISDRNSGYEEAKELILNIINAINIPIERVFIVPGNHDIDRNFPKDREKIAKEKWDSDILDGEENDFINKLIVGQSKFFETYKEILRKEYPIEKVHFIEKINEDIAIIHLNTSWMCSNSNEETGKLHIGLNKIYDCLSNDNLENMKIKIAIGHHNLSDLNAQVRNNLKSLFDTSDIDLYLGGHHHKAIVSFDSSINTEFCICYQGRAEDINYPAGFIVGNINSFNGQNYFQFFNWNATLVKWTYDYTVDLTKHGKYYLNGKKFKNLSKELSNIIIDLKLFNISLDYNEIFEKFHLKNSEIYKTSLQDFTPNTAEEWIECILEIKDLYDKIVNNTNKKIHIFPMALIPLLVGFGYLIQNNSSNILIYQYYENEAKWVLDEEDNDIKGIIEYENNDNEKLAVLVNVSGKIKLEDVQNAMSGNFDILKASIEEPRISKLNYKNDVQRFKNTLKVKLDEINSSYKELHLFLYAPAGLCIEIGRIIRENIYPNTYIYNYDSVKYKRIVNLKDIRKITKTTLS